VDARIGKLLVLAASFGCLAPALSIAACLSYKAPWGGGVAQQEAATAARRALAAPGCTVAPLAAGQQSDHLVLAAAVEGWLEARRRGGGRAARDFSKKHLLSDQTLEMLAEMRGQFAGILADAGFVAGGRGAGRDWVEDGTAPWNRYSMHPAVLKAVLLASLYPNVAAVTEEQAGGGGRAGPSGRPMWFDGAGEVCIHPSSVNHKLTASHLSRPYVTYLEKVSVRVRVSVCRGARS
jgi:ATP-dependent RNA helicase DHX29